MLTATLGRTGLRVNKNGFGALPIQRAKLPESTRILQAARAAGIDFFDTARGYTDSEEKLGIAFGGEWEGLTLATKTPAKTAADFWKDIETSLRLLKRDYIDIYQFHNPPQLPLPGDGSGLYEAMLQAKEKGLIRFIGVTNHRLSVATQAVESGLYDSLQFPFSYLSAQPELDLVSLCRKHNVGFIAMKALAGGLITNVAVAAAWMDEQGDVVPIWGIQSMSEIEALAAAIGQTAGLTEEHQRHIERDRAELQGEFCRACGYCMPCPEGIQINTCARVIKLMHRSPMNLLTEEWQAEMAKIENCTGCRQCVAKCPYGLETPALLRKNLEEYRLELAAAKG